MTLLKTLFHNIYPLPNQFWNELLAGVNEKTIARRTTIIKEGKACREIFFVVKGLTRAYYFKNDTDVTSRFIREGELIIPINQENVELIEDSRLIVIPNDLLTRLHSKYPGLNLIMRTIAEHNYILSEERSYSMRMRSARERYEDLLQNDPQIFLRVPLKHIATYLGMKPETLSRIRAQR